MQRPFFFSIFTQVSHPDGYALMRGGCSFIGKSMPTLGDYFAVTFAGPSLEQGQNLFLKVVASNRHDRSIQRASLLDTQPVFPKSLLSTMAPKLNLEDRVSKLEDWKQDMEKVTRFRLEGFTRIQQKCRECHAGRSPNKFWPLKEALAELMIADLDPHLEHCLDSPAS